jgi:aldehyde dehydrogenase (NAD+)
MQLNYIGNAWQASASGLFIPVMDPSDGQTYEQIQRSNAADIDAAVRAAQDGLQRHWRQLSAAERGRLLMQLSRKITEHADELAAIEQRDCGKPTQQARADAHALARYFEFYAGPATSCMAKPFPTRTASAC